MRLFSKATREIMLKRNADGQLVAKEKGCNDMTGWAEIIQGLKVGTGYDKDLTKGYEFMDAVEGLVATVKENTPMKLGDVLLRTHIKAIVCKSYDGETVSYEKKLVKNPMWNTEIIGRFPDLLDEEVAYFVLNADYIVFVLQDEKLTDEEVMLMAGKDVVKRLK